MGVSSHHKDYDKWFPVWKKCRDVVEGQEKIHEGGEIYLSKFKSEQETDYNVRKERTPFFEATGRTIEGMRGMLFRKAPVVEVNDEKILDNINLDGISFVELMMNGVMDALEVNRFGILTDYPVVNPDLTQADVNGIVPSMNIYKAENIINWKTDVVNGRAILSMVVLQEEVEKVVDEFESETVIQYRVLDLIEGSYRVRLFNEEENQIDEDIFPMMGGSKLEHIPFEFYPAIDIIKPPLLGMINMNLAHYTTTADYEHGCHISGLPTLFITGHTPKEGAKIYIGGPTAQSLPDSEATAFYVEVTGDFGALKDNIEGKENKMAILSSRMLEQQKKQTETVEVATIHRAGDASTLSTIGRLLSKVFTRSLKNYVEWMNGSADNVHVELNKDFIPFGISPQLITSMLQAVQAGKMSNEAFFENMKQGEMYPENVDFEEEQMRIDNQGHHWVPMNKDIPIHDDILNNALVSLRLSAGINKNIRSELNALEKDISSMLRKSDIAQYKRGELNDLLNLLKRTIKAKFIDVQTIITTEADEIAKITAASTAKSIETAFLAEVPMSTPPTVLLTSGVQVQGATTSAWIGKQSTDTAFRVLSSIRSDLSGSLSKPSLIKNVQGELDVSKRHAETFVNTYVQTLGNNARLETYRENSEVIKGVEWVTALDGRVCKLCIPRDGLQWTVDGKPIGGHGVVFKVPPIHFNDRCVLVPVTRTFKELGIDIPEPVGKRSARTGNNKVSLSSNVDFEEFLTRREFTNPSYADDVLGPGRADLWRKGKITMRDLISGTGRELTLDEIKNAV